MGHRLKLDVENYNEIAMEIYDSTAFVEEYFHQCWCILAIPVNPTKETDVMATGVPL